MSLKSYQDQTQGGRTILPDKYHVQVRAKAGEGSLVVRMGLQRASLGLFPKAMRTVERIQTTVAQ